MLEGVTLKHLQNKEARSKFQLQIAPWRFWMNLLEYNAAMEALSRGS